jgi:murein DD-endopeptidase MepM/ murein hydrolase activator NlpD
MLWDKLKSKNLRPKIAAAIIFVALFFVTSNSLLAETSRIDELRAQIDERSSQMKSLEAEIAKYQAQIDEQEKAAKTLQGQLKNINSSINKLSASIKLTESKIAQTNLELEKIKIEIFTKENKITANRDFLAATLREMRETESQSLAEMLLANLKISDFFGSLKRLEDVEGGLGSQLTALKNDKEELEGDRADYSAEKDKLEKLQNQLEDRKDIEDGAKQEKQSLLSNTKNKEAEYQKMLIAREKERAAILKDIATIEDELRKLIDPEALPPAHSGVLTWPVEPPIVRQEFGMTSFAKSNSDVYNGKGHNGIDLKASVGTLILAADDGVVLRTGNTDLTCPGGSYGKWIVVEHANNLATLYAHLSLIKVNEGQSVARGEMIAYSGNTGYTTGPHLHFTVYAAGKAGEIRFGPSPSGRCKLLPFGGYLNPLDYL